MIAERWRESGLAPHAKPPGAGEGGNDMVDGPPGLAVEIKARTTVTLPSILAATRAKEPDKALAIVLWRHDGQGEAHIGQWTVTMTVQDFEALYLAAASFDKRLEGLQ